MAKGTMKRIFGYWCAGGVDRSYQWSREGGFIFQNHVNAVQIGRTCLKPGTVWRALSIESWECLWYYKIFKNGECWRCKRDLDAWTCAIQNAISRKIVNPSTIKLVTKNWWHENVDFWPLGQKGGHLLSWAENGVLWCNVRSDKNLVLFLSG